MPPLAPLAQALYSVPMKYSVLPSKGLNQGLCNLISDSFSPYKSTYRQILLSLIFSLKQMQTSAKARAKTMMLNKTEIIGVIPATFLYHVWVMLLVWETYGGFHFYVLNTVVEVF